MIKFSIITVCYNSDQFIRSAIDSVLSQSYDNIEYIVIDGNSKDDTVSIVKSYGDKVTQFISEPDRGIYDAMNKGLLLAKGDVIAILNSDDFYPHSCVIAKVVQAFEQYPNADMVLGNVNFVKPNKVNVTTRFYSSFGFSPWKMRFGFMPAHTAAFIKRSAYEKVGNYSYVYKTGADFEWFIRAFFKHRVSHVKINDILTTMREGGVSSSGFQSYCLTSKEQLKALKENNLYSNLIFVLVRLPVKFFQKCFNKSKN